MKSDEKSQLLKHKWSTALNVFNKKCFTTNAL